MKYFVGAVLFLFSFKGQSQPLRDINYNYLYNPSQQVDLSLRITKSPDGIRCFYKLHWKDTTANFSIHWELRASLSDKEGSAISNIVDENETGGTIVGEVIVPVPAAPQVLVAKATNESAKQAWMFYRIIEPSYPVNSYLSTGGENVFQNFINIRQEVSFHASGDSSVVTYYNDDFPSAAPVFSETQARVSRRMMPDSIYRVATGTGIRFSKKGLYLLQKDTSSVEGLSFRAEDDYPRLSKVQSLADPLIYVCTKQEFDKIKAAKGDKKAFDRVILGITGDTERARTFMRSYFRRVELANQYFTSYKEGWKTDRGMIYIIFGLPDEVYKFSDREVWNYKNTTYKITFNFAKSGTIFDPDNFVLIREKKYQETWYEVIDLWRNARF